VEQSELHKLMGDGDFYRQPGDKITGAMERLDAVNNELEACYTRWETLEAQARAADD
jgi:ABC transport system ATP-binding/permease protein